MRPQQACGADDGAGAPFAVLRDDGRRGHHHHQPRESTLALPTRELGGGGGGGFVGLLLLIIVLLIKIDGCSSERTEKEELRAARERHQWHGSKPCSSELALGEEILINNLPLALKAEAHKLRAPGSWLRASGSIDARRGLGALASECSRLLLASLCACAHMQSVGMRLLSKDCREIRIGTDKQTDGRTDGRTVAPA